MRNAKIFVSIASYRDSELVPTVYDLLEKAENPENLRISVMEQSPKSEKSRLPDISQIQHLWIPAQQAKGAGYARHLAQQTYNDEDYYLQIDSHTRFAKGWDTSLIKMLHDMQDRTGNGKIILSQFPAPYRIVDEGRVEKYHIKDFPDDIVAHRVKWKNGYYSAVRQKHHHNGPQECHTILAGYVFAPGYIVKEIPYDPEISFMGEELCFAIRAWTRGWRIYAPDQTFLWHFYHRRGYHRVSDARNNAGKKWGGIEQRSREKQLKVYSGQDLGIFGAASKHSLSQYLALIDETPYERLSLWMNDHKKVDKTTASMEIGPDFFAGMEKTISQPCIRTEHDMCPEIMLGKKCQCECHDDG